LNLVGIKRKKFIPQIQGVRRTSGSGAP
jgi:hypothetical protein